MTAPARSALHSCPGDCGAQVPRHRRRAADPRGHSEALRTALGWYRANPKTPR